MSSKTNFRLRDVLLVSIILIFSTSITNSQTPEAQNRNKNVKIFWVERITADGQLVLREYNFRSTRSINIPELEIWSEKLNTEDPSGFMYWDAEPDLKYTLLRQGLARLKDATSASKEYIEAENEAKSKGVGMWSVPPQSTPSPPSSVPSSSPNPDETQPSFIDKIINWNWKKLGSILITFIVGAITIYGGASFIKLITDWRKRHKVPIVFIGRPSTGKTWLWSRLLDPDISEKELSEIQRNEIAFTKRAATPKPMGRYEIIPDYTDTPGGEPGIQVTELLAEQRKFRWLRKFLIPTKSVWIMMLATTQENSAQRESALEQKIDSEYIAEQLGHLDLPLGILASARTPNPQMVVICIGKFDLFADDDSRALSSKDARILLEKLFQKHISRIKDECEKQGIPSPIIFSSARKGWGANDILRQISKALFED
jgi:hypothetical protein